MKKSTALIATVAAAAAVFTASAQAGTSSVSEFRGYNNCLEAATKPYEGVVADRAYYLSRAGSAQTYYINATAWASGDRVHLRITCDTSKNGRELLRSSIDSGRFKLARPTVRVEVAGQ
ncbi:MAG: hypothetical protein O6766_10560 [Gammaproteobacteria bacterium]|nr:hypothetical protein [Gammaproteobacteria bacterium]